MASTKSKESVGNENAAPFPRRAEHSQRQISAVSSENSVGVKRMRYMRGECAAPTKHLIFSQLQRPTVHNAAGRLRYFAELSFARIQFFKLNQRIAHLIGHRKVRSIS